MTFRRGQTGNPNGRPPRAAEMRAALKMNADQIARLLPAVRMTAHDLLRSVYTSDAMPLPIRLQAATACLAIEHPRQLSAAELLDRMRHDQLTGSRKAAAPGRNGADHGHRRAAAPTNGKHQHHTAPAGNGDSGAHRDHPATTPAEPIELAELLGG